MYLLPKEHPATKKILESPTNIPCDIYAENSGESVKQQIDDFMKFVESHLNKVRKSHIQRSTTRVSSLHMHISKSRFISPHLSCSFFSLVDIFINAQKNIVFKILLYSKTAHPNI